MLKEIIGGWKNYYFENKEVLLNWNYDYFETFKIYHLVYFPFQDLEKI
jgi:hypothetical protein